MMVLKSGTKIVYFEHVSISQHISAALCEMLDRKGVEEETSEQGEMLVSLGAGRSTETESKHP